MNVKSPGGDANLRLFQVKLGGKMFRRLRCRATHVASKTLTALGIGLCAAGPLAIQAHAATSNPIVTTAEGKVEGFVVAGVAEFLGIPYAAPPVSTNPSAPACSPTNLRWCPTVAHAPWSGVLKAMAFGPTCAQNSELGVFAGPPNNNEDCLYLNVYKPANAKGRLAVIVFIHGGGSIDGESNDYDGSKLAAIIIIALAVYTSPAMNENNNGKPPLSVRRLVDVEIETVFVIVRRPCKDAEFAVLCARWSKGHRL